MSGRRLYAVMVAAGVTVAGVVGVVRMAAREAEAQRALRAMGWGRR